MKLYPIRTTRDKWSINILSHHKCDVSCATLVEECGDFLNISKNPYYNPEANLCDRCKSHEKVACICSLLIGTILSVKTEVVLLILKKSLYLINHSP